MSDAVVAVSLVLLLSPDASISTVEADEMRRSCLAVSFTTATLGYFETFIATLLMPRVPPPTSLVTRPAQTSRGVPGAPEAFLVAQSRLSPLHSTSAPVASQQPALDGESASLASNHHGQAVRPPKFPAAAQVDTLTEMLPGPDHERFVTITCCCGCSAVSVVSTAPLAVHCRVISRP